MYKMVKKKSLAFFDHKDPMWWKSRLFADDFHRRMFDFGDV